jgi:hypothetical protein
MSTFTKRVRNTIVLSVVAAAAAAVAVLGVASSATAESNTNLAICLPRFCL